MAEFEKHEYKFPDEIDEGKTVDQIKDDVEEEGKFSVEIEDDTPPEDRGRRPSEKEFVEKLDKDELEEYSEAARKKINEFKKVFHDERREKERALREQEEAIALAKKMYEENKKLQERLSSGEQALVSTYKQSANNELELAKKAYRDAYESGDTDRIIEAQEKMTEAKMKAAKAEAFVPQKALQHEDFDVQFNKQRQQTEVPQPDTKAKSWQERNAWFGQDEEMTSLALGLHEKLVKENGMAYATTDEYYKRIDATMRKRFPENFGDEETQETTQRVTKPTNVVAPATRSTSSKKIKLKASQVAIAKKLGLTPEQYAQAVLKMEA